MTEEESLTFSIEMALTKALPPARLRRLDEGGRRVAAQLIVEHLWMCGYVITRGPPARWHTASVHPQPPR